MSNTASELVDDCGMGEFLAQIVIYEGIPVTRRHAMKLAAKRERCWTAVGDVACYPKAVAVNTPPVSLQDAFEYLSRLGNLNPQPELALMDDGRDPPRIAIAYSPANEV